MANPAYIQSATGNSVASPTTAVFSNSVGKGSLIIVSVGETPNTATVTSITDSLGTYYGNLQASSGGGAGSTTQFMGITLSSGANTITVSTTGTPTAIVVSAREYTGMPASIISSGGYNNGASDNYIEAIANVTSSSTSSAPSTNITTNSPVLIVAMDINNSSATYTLGANFSNLDSVSSGTLFMGVEHRFVSLSGSQAVTINLSASVLQNLQAKPIRTVFPLKVNNYQQVKVGDGMGCGEKIR